VINGFLKLKETISHFSSRCWTSVSWVA